jgi:uncharacterized protein
MWMGPIMSWLNSKKIIKWLRILHRDLGYFFVGITLVYGVSGIILVHKKQGVDPAYKTVRVTKQFPQNMNEAQFTALWEKELEDYKLNTVLSDQSKLKVFVDGGVGDYDIDSGKLSFEVYQRKPVVFFINKLHFNQIKGWTFFADFFSDTLIFLAISGLFIVQGKNGFRKRGIWFMIAGILLVLIFVWI